VSVWLDTYDAEMQKRAAQRLAIWAQPAWLRIKAQACHESSLNPFALSSQGAQGLLQFMPDTWPQWRDLCGYGPGITPYNASAAIDCGCAYMAHLYSQWHADERTEIDRWRLALACYDAGTGVVLNAQRQSKGATDYATISAFLPDETRAYAPSIEIILGNLQ